VEATRNRRCGAGFTLIELLVVMAIIAILAALLTPALIAAMRKAHEASTQNIIHQVDLAAHSFFNDKGDYPPSTWAEINKIFKVNLNPGVDNTYDPADPADAIVAGAGTNPSTINEGIEVLTACLATQNGGPYLEPSAKILRNVDGQVATGNPDPLWLNGDYDANGLVRACTNWYFTTANVFEIVDWWQNPLIYFHNRDYVNHDGFNNATGLPPDWTEAVIYADVDGLPHTALDRSPNGLASGTYPNLNSFQLYSWGYKGPVDSSNNLRFQPAWTKQATGAITNWEE